MNFFNRPLSTTPYSQNPMSFLDPDVRHWMQTITEIHLIENADVPARVNWQNTQLTNLLRHAVKKSKFWQTRIPSRTPNSHILKLVPPLTRDELRTQIETEGPLLVNKNGEPTQSYSTTGSTGTPIKVYVTSFNGQYNQYRSLAEYFIHDRPLDKNRLQVDNWDYDLAKMKVEHRNVWAGPLASLFKNGNAKKIIIPKDGGDLLAEISKSPIGYLRCSNKVMETILGFGGTELLQKLEMYAWIHLSDDRDPQIVDTLKNAGIPSISNYSSGEVGWIASECPTTQNYFHVTTSNVVVEEDKEVTVQYQGQELSRLLITHLHSYATPIIRYDVGDFGKLHQQCACGHTGPTLSHIYGRKKNFLKTRDGRHIPFFGRGHEVMRGIPFRDCRITQMDFDHVRFELACENVLPSETIEIIRTRLLFLMGSDFNIEIDQVASINWSDNRKKLFFSSRV